MIHIGRVLPRGIHSVTYQSTQAVETNIAIFRSSISALAYGAGYVSFRETKTFGNPAAGNPAAFVHGANTTQSPLMPAIAA